MLLALVAVAGCGDIKIPSGKLRCGNGGGDGGACPPGFSCNLAHNTCDLNGDAGTKNDSGVKADGAADGAADVQADRPTGGDTAGPDAVGGDVGPAPDGGNVSCPALANPAGGVVTTPLLTAGSTATYSCNIGSKLSGSMTRTCGAGGSWTDSAPTCTVADCGPLTAPSDGMVATTPGTTYGSVATYTCGVGFGASGSSTRTCQQDGTWDGMPPSCVIANCPSLAGPAGGTVVATTLTYGSMAAYACNSGYTLAGSTSRTCQPDGTWSSAAPTCSIKDCGALTAPMNGTASAPVTTYGATGTYACSSGYTVSGAGTVTCGTNGTWSSAAPTCLLKNCGALTAPANGSVNATVTTFGASATYSCTTGYLMSGGATRACGADGNWTGTAPTCSIADCGALTAPSNGSVSDPKTTYGSMATYACTTGYGPSGSATRTCQASGAWDGVAPTCVIANCPALPGPTGGSVSAPALTYGATATYSCNAGYTLGGTSTRTCQASGAWTGTAATCTIADCGALAAPTSGSVSAPVTTYGASATYACNAGYGASGAVTRTCQANATWSGTAPTCGIKDCGALAGPNNGSVTATVTTYGSTATYACNAGYSVTGTATRTCQSDGTWSGAAASCTIKDCGALSAPANGGVSAPTTTVGGTATYSCITGYGPSGSATRTCQTDGTWSGAAPTCVIANCPALLSPTGGVVAAPTLTYNSTATYTCNAGYNLDGTGTRTCQANGVWSAAAPTCDAKDCGAPGSPLNGAVTYTATTYTNVAHYTCNGGYTLSGSTTRTCQSDQSWSSTVPTCVPANCGALSVANGTVTYSATTYGSSASYTCNTNFTLSGTSPVTCQANGAWSSSPTCVDICSVGGNNGTSTHCCNNNACPVSAPDCNTANHTCAQKVGGEACTSASQCGTGHCVPSSSGAGSVCCNTGCAGACDSKYCPNGTCGAAPSKTFCGTKTGPSGPGQLTDTTLFCNGQGACIAPTIICTGFNSVSCNLQTNACCVTDSGSSYVCVAPTQCTTPNDGDFFSGWACIGGADCPTSYDCCGQVTPNGEGHWSTCVPSGTCTGELEP